MNGIFSFRFRDQDSKSEKRESLAIYMASNIKLDVVSKLLKNDVVENLTPYKVYIIGFKDHLPTLDNLKANASFASEFNSYVGSIKDKAVCLEVNNTGEVHHLDGSKPKPKLKKAILHDGMIALFKKHRGVITSAQGYHFLKPSGDHCDKFIRASNLLISSPEVSFLAIALLPHLSSNIERVYIDTSSIAYLVSTAIQLSKSFRTKSPTIESFESYVVFERKYDFVEDNNSLVLISATTSGSLGKELLQKTTFSKKQILTLFYVSLPNDQTGLFNISEAIPNGIISKKPSECLFCKRGAKLIRIGGDQFLPENPKHELLVIRKSDFGSHREKFFSQFAATNTLKWNRVASRTDEFSEHFYIDLEYALKADAPFLNQALKKSLRRHISRDLKTIITLDDIGSECLSDSVKSHLDEDSKSIKWFKENFSAKELNTESSVLVIAGAITSGRKLLSVARKLRSLNPSATITYLVGFLKLPNTESNTQLEKDLCQGGHELVVLEKCRIPRISPRMKTAWDLEQEILRPYCDVDPIDDEYDIAPPQLNTRYKSLAQPSAGENDLFLESPPNKSLKLRQTFAFWSDIQGIEKKIPLASQADVYWTIQAVLHDLRTKSNEDGLASAYHTTLISPANFDRYNDGIIQAALLRASLPVELDYQADAKSSRQMTDIIVSVVSNWENEQGEATYEFLISLWTQRLKLQEVHLSEILDLAKPEMPDALKFILSKITLKARV